MVLNRWDCPNSGPLWWNILVSETKYSGQSDTDDSCRFVVQVCRVSRVFRGPRTPSDRCSCSSGVGTSPEMTLPPVLRTVLESPTLKEELLQKGRYAIPSVFTTNFKINPVLVVVGFKPFKTHYSLVF